MEQSEEKDERDTAGGFNPDRPNKIKTVTVGPLPTDNPKDVRTSTLKDEVRKEVGPDE